MKRALVTGGAGFIGFALGKQLAASDYSVVVCDNLSRGKMDDELKTFLKKPNVEFVQCDLTKPEELAKLGTNFDYVYHLAAVQGTKNFYDKPAHVSRTNILCTINLLDWFVQLKKGKILFSSSSEAYASTISKFNGKIPTPEDIPLTIEDVYNPRWSYAASKLAGEVLFANYGKAYGIDFVIIRYHNVYGPRMGFDHVMPEFIMRTLKGENPFNIYGGTETRAFCYVDDAVRATQLVMESKATNETIHIGNDKTEVSIIDFAKDIHKLMGYKTEIKVNPAPKGSVARRCPDITKLRSLGFEPKISLKQGLKQSIDWYTNYFKTNKLP